MGLTMRPLVALVVGAIASVAAAAGPADSCRFSGVPSVICATPQAAATVYRQVGRRWAMVDDENNRMLLRQSACTVIRLKEFDRLPVYPMTGPVKVATPLGLTMVQRVTLPDVPGLPAAMYAASGYLTHPCDAAH